MVQAILAGRKTQTRRIATNIPDVAVNVWPIPNVGWFCNTQEHEALHSKKMRPKCEVGDLIWVRETFCELHKNHVITKRHVYLADMDPVLEDIRQEYIKAGYNYKWKPSIHMPKAAARIWLRCTGVKAERVRDISMKDIIAEGVRCPVGSKGTVLWTSGEKNSTLDLLNMISQNSTRTRDDLFLFIHWAKLWIDINGRESWDANPWVWAYSFEVLSTNGRPDNI